MRTVPGTRTENLNQDSYESRLFPIALHRLPPKGYMRLFALEPSDSVKGWFVNQFTGMTVSPAPESTTRVFGNGLLEIDVCICQAVKTYTWEDFAFASSSRSNCFDPKQSGVVSLSRFSSSGSTKNLMFVLVDVCPLMRLSLATCLTGKRRSLSLMVFS